DRIKPDKTGSNRIKPDRRRHSSILPLNVDQADVGNVLPENRDRTTQSRRRKKSDRTRARVVTAQGNDRHRQLLIRRNDHPRKPGRLIALDHQRPRPTRQKHVHPPRSRNKRRRHTHHLIPAPEGPNQYPKDHGGTHTNTARRDPFHETIRHRNPNAKFEKRWEGGNSWGPRARGVGVGAKKVEPPPARPTVTPVPT